MLCPACGIKFTPWAPVQFLSYSKYFLNPIFRVRCSFVDSSTLNIYFAIHQSVYPSHLYFDESVLTSQEYTRIQKGREKGKIRLSKWMHLRGFRSFRFIIIHFVSILPKKNTGNLGRKKVYVYSDAKHWHTPELIWMLKTIFALLRNSVIHNFMTMYQTFCCYAICIESKSKRQYREKLPPEKESTFHNMYFPLSDWWKREHEREGEWEFTLANVPSV